jgi:transcriptional regulator with XRE-family HTH domain
VREVNFIRAVQEIQQATGMTDEELAKRCGVQRATISAIRRGQTKNPSYGLGTKLVAIWEASR